ncbi:MAG: diguanylate cyclase [Sphaerochaetaceae bacterium]|nr:diguanylate cyclase [Spirochaetales bacterium]MDY5499939.1 diguanylate cyclase [Sphaerochaetaceae bacterium]
MQRKHTYVLLWIGIAMAVGIGILSVSTYRQDIASQQQKADYITEAYADELENKFTHVVSISNTLKEWVIDKNGVVDDFEGTRRLLMREYLAQIELAPDGVVSHGYDHPIDLLGSASGPLFQYAKDTNSPVLAGPFLHPNGGRVVTVINPVAIADADGRRNFWGFIIFTIKLPDVYAQTLNRLKSYGYDYCLDTTSSPLSSVFTRIESSRPQGEVLRAPVGHTFEVGGCKWTLNVEPVGGWTSDRLPSTLLSGVLAGLAILFLAYLLLKNQEHEEALHKLVSMDSLTGLYNRGGFMQQLEETVRANPEIMLTAVFLDLDDFKLVNDLFGHAAGDMALQDLAVHLQHAFPKDSLIGRTGGDEFSVIIKGRTPEECRHIVEQAIRGERKLTSGDQSFSYTVSAGYADYPAQAKDCSRLMTLADDALYSSKLGGKHDARHYEPRMSNIKREPLAFSSKTLAAGIPGSLLVRKTDAEGTILFANDELLTLLGCADFDDLLDYSHAKYQNLIHPDDREHVEATIWRNPEGTSGKLRYYDGFVEYRVLTKKGVEKPIVSMRRLVHDPHYGDVFFVLIRSAASMPEATLKG